MNISNIILTISNTEQTLKNLNNLLIREIYNKVSYTFCANNINDKYVDRFYYWLKGVVKNNPCYILSYLNAALITKDMDGFCYLKPIDESEYESDYEDSNLIQIPYKIIILLYNELEK